MGDYLDVTNTRQMSPERSSQQDLYSDAVAAHGAALMRLARSYENDPDRRQDLLQEIHFAVWRSLALFDGRCSLRTWVYRVAHNVATSHAVRDRRHQSRRLVSLEALDATPQTDDTENPAEARMQLEWVARMIQQLEPLDRQVVLLYLEGMNAASISDVTGLSPANVATKVHRIKAALAKRARQGEHHGS